MLFRNRYTIDRILGEGGFGYVYLAHDKQNQLFAIKQCIDLSNEVKDQFIREMTLLRVLSLHPLFPQVHEEFDERLPWANTPTDPSYKFAVLEYVPGRTFDSLIEERIQLGQAPFDEADVLAWTVQILDALEHAHNRQIIHRDIKPANIMLLPDGKHVKVIDVGIAKIGGVGTKTQRGAAAASPGYAPPEQYAQAGQTDRFTDIYATGATMYNLLTGVQPTEAPARMSGMQSLIPPQQINPRVSPLVEAVILRAMEIDVTRRYQTAADMLAALQGKSVTVTQPCPKCGHANKVTARFCQQCSTPLQGFTFQQAGVKVQTLAELASTCDIYWAEAVGYLTTSKFDQWFQSQGVSGAQWVSVLQNVRAQYPTDPNLQLDAFLRQADPQRPLAQMRVQPAQPATVKVEQGNAHTHMVTITNDGRSYLVGTIAASEAWTTVKPASVVCAPGQTQSIQVILDTTALAGSPTGKPYAAQVNVQTNGGSTTLVYQVQVTASPHLAITPDRLDFGQMQHGQTLSRQVQITNAGAGNLSASLHPNAAWLQVMPANVAVGARSQQMVTVTVLARTVSERGAQSGEIHVHAGTGGMVTVQVAMSVGGAFSLSCDANTPIQNVKDLIGWCDTHWHDAVALLRSGELHAAVRYLGEPAKGLLKHRSSDPWPVVIGNVQQAAALPDANIGLECALRALGADPPVPSHNWGEVERSLGMGMMPDPRWMMPWWPGPSLVVFRINNQGRGYLHGQLNSPVRWLVIDDPHFGCLPGQEAQVQIRVFKKLRRLSGLTPELLDLQVD